MKVRSYIKENTTDKDNQANIWFLEEINTIDKLSARPIRK